MNESEVNLEYGACRFCLTLGNHRHLMKEYEWNGGREVYFKIFLECFNVFLSTKPGKSNLICSLCVLKLRDATSFKKMVLVAEMTLSSCEIKQEETVTDTVEQSEISQMLVMELKHEAIESSYIKHKDGDSNCDSLSEQVETDAVDKSEISPMLVVKSDPAELSNIEHHDDKSEISPMLVVKNEPVELSNIEHNDEDSDSYSMPEQEDSDAVDKSEISPMLVVKNEPVEFSNAMQFSNLEHNDGDSDSDSMPEQEDSEPACLTRKNNRKEKLAYIYNTRLILESSNVAPFRPKYQNGFLCFYCSMPCEDLAAMKKHQQKHTKTELNTKLSSIGAEAYIVYVDVTDLQCTICNEQISSLTELKSHLDKKHNKKMQDCPDRIIPFKLKPNVFECQVCKCNYETYGALERHMNVHFRNYVCKKCGAGFVTKSRFKVHTKQHDEGSFQCDKCKKVYTTPKKLKGHVDLVHKMVKRFKCLKCDERFMEYLKRQKHMEEVHGVAKLEYKCKVCDKVFESQLRLTVHKRRLHLKKR